MDPLITAALISGGAGLAGGLLGRPSQGPTPPPEAPMAPAPNNQGGASSPNGVVNPFLGRSGDAMFNALPSTLTAGRGK